MPLPKTEAIWPILSPNFPPPTLMRSSSLPMMLETTDSTPAVPEPEMMATSLWDWKRYFKSSLVSASIWVYSGLRWAMAGLLMACNTLGWILTGPANMKKLS